jgi:hypothetical protein
MILNKLAVQSRLFVFGYILIDNRTHILRTRDLFRVLRTLIEIGRLSVIRLTSMRSISLLLIMMMMVMMIVIFEGYFLVLKLNHDWFIYNNGSSCSRSSTGTWLILRIVTLRLIRPIWMSCETCRGISLLWLLVARGRTRVADNCFIKLLIYVIKKGGIIKIPARRIWMPSTHVNQVLLNLFYFWWFLLRPFR